MYCPICGEPLKKGVASCQKCGTPLDWSDADLSDAAEAEAAQDPAAAAAAGASAAAAPEVSAETPSYYKAIDSENSFAPDAGFNGVTYNSKSAEETPKEENPYEGSAFVPVGGGSGSGSGGNNYNSRYDDEDPDDRKRRLLYWILIVLVLAAIVVLIVVLFRWLSSREVKTKVGETTAYVTESSEYAFSTKATLAPVIGYTVPNNTTDKNGYIPPFVYVTVTPTPAPTPTPTPEPTPTPSPTPAPTATPTPTPTPAPTPTPSPAPTATPTPTPSPTPAPTSTPAPTPTPTAAPTATPTPAPTVKPTESSTPAQSSAKPTESSSKPSESSQGSGSAASEPSASGKPTGSLTEPGGSSGSSTVPTKPHSTTSSEISPQDPLFSDIYHYVSNQLQHLSTINDGNPDTPSRPLILPDFNRISEISDPELVKYFMGNVLLSINGTKDPFQTPELPLSAINSYMQKYINPAINLNPSADYKVLPYVYEKGVFKIPPTITPAPDKTDTTQITTFLTNESVAEQNGSYSLTQTMLTYTRASISGLNDHTYRLVTDASGELVGLTVDEIDGIANNWTGIQNSSNAIYFLSAAEMKNELPYVRYNLSKGESGQFFINSKGTYSAPHPTAAAQKRLNEIRRAFTSGTATAEAPDGGLTVYSQPNTGSSVIGTLQAGTEYVTFEFNNPNFKIALVNDSLGSHLGYVRK